MRCTCVTSLFFAAVNWENVAAFTTTIPTTLQRQNRDGNAFTPLRPLYELIEGAALDFVPVEPTEGGVGLTQESAVKLCGYVKHKPGVADIEIEDLLRYTELTQVDESTVQDSMNKLGASVVCTGIGRENFVDPGETTVSQVVLAPSDAVRDALNAAGSTQQYDEISINFLGGDDLIICQWTDALQELTLKLDLATKTKVSFNSLCHKSLPLETVTLTIVGLKNTESKPASEVEKSIARGDIYFREGSWLTVLEGNINTAEF